MRYSTKLMVPGLLVLVMRGTAPAIADNPDPFTEEAALRGLEVFISQGGNQTQFGCGICLADLDGDGDADAVILGGTPTVRIFANSGAGQFSEKTSLSALPNLASPSGIVAGDIDADGDLDLFITGWLSGGAMLRNDGGMVFSDITPLCGVSRLDYCQGATFGDYDGDGWIDLYICKYDYGLTMSDMLYRNLGGGVFQETTGPTGLTESAFTFHASFFDYDRDGDADLYVGNDRGPLPQYENELWRNDGGVFTNVTAQSGTGADVCTMGVALGDLDHNGYLDIYVTNSPMGNKLLTCNGDGTFKDSTAQAGVVSNQFDWGTLFFDYDNDGTLDLYVCTETGYQNRLYSDMGKGWPMMDIASVVQVAEEGISMTCATADIDGDGDLDLAVQKYQEPLKLFINHEGSKRHWVKLRVVGQGKNTHGYGTQIDVEAAGVKQMSEVIAGNGLKSMIDPVQHFGLGAAVKMDKVTVRWPGGTQRVLMNYPADKTWTLYPPERLGDANGDGKVSQSDLGGLLAFYGAGGAAPFLPGCEVFDFDGDADVDQADLGALLAKYTP